MEDSPYRPSETGLGRDLNHSDATAPQRDRFGPFSFGRSFELAGQALKRDFGTSVGLYGLMFLLVSAASAACCVGWIFALPHLLAGASLMGYYLVRGDLSADHLFAGFRRYGTVLVASIVFLCGYMVVYLVFGGPYHFKLASLLSQLDWSEKGDRSFEWLAKGLQSGGLGPYSIFSYIATGAGAYLTGRWLLCFPLVVDRGYGALESLAVSWRVTRPYHWWLMLLVLLSNTVAFLGVAFCIVGVFLSYPLGMALQGAALVQLLGDVPATGSGGGAGAGQRESFDGDSDPIRSSSGWEPPSPPAPRPDGRGSDGSPSRDSNPYG